MRTICRALIVVAVSLSAALSAEAATCSSPSPPCFAQNFTVPLPQEASGAFLGQVDNPTRLFLFVAVLDSGFDPDGNGTPNYRCFVARGFFDPDGDNVTAQQDPNDLAEYSSCGDLGDAFTISGKTESFEITGDPSTDPPTFAFAGWRGRGSGGVVNVMTKDPDGDGRFEGKANRSLVRNFGFPVQQHDTTLFCESLGLCGSFVELEHFQAFFNTDNSDAAGGGLVLSWGFAEISLRKQVH